MTNTDLSTAPLRKKGRGKARPNPLPAEKRSHYRPDEYAARIGVSRRILDGWMMKKKIIPYSKIGHIVLIDPELADAAIDEFRRKGVKP
jgi:hypothetical protein